ncbi:hypothetical protein M3Y14_08345 [Bacillus thuringiensis]|nr:hypothetical protein M3Y14_08345 [Bacillus thuringiensis]
MEIAHNLFTKWNYIMIEMNGEEDYIHISLIFRHKFT